MEDNFSAENLIERVKAPTSDFWKKIRNGMITIGAVGAALLAVPVSVVALPAVIITAAGYAVAVGSVGAALAQLTKK